MSIELGRIISDSVKRVFPIRAKTFDEYVTLLKDERASVVEAVLIARERNILALVAWLNPAGYTRSCVFGARFKSQSERGRLLLYEDIYTRKVVNSYEPEQVGGVMGKKEAVFRTLLTMNGRLKEITDELPSMGTHMSCYGRGFVFDREMVRSAQEYNISAWNLEP